MIRLGYGIPIYRHFYMHKPPHPLDEIEEDITWIQDDIVGLSKGLA